ncbi:hypothetical protein [Actinomadura sp. BRA 177]|uniref:hypothetical protein n=1 Tax=Actinomadura sp. BRA 177 TaxID=2745202 RepID=UPI001595FA3C|nr:hypothetical protein [Actinomadura sp. BRA 177]NVI86016.1 hypothetical protein [Actinomadura sp. BRA 177]
MVRLDALRRNLAVLAALVLAVTMSAAVTTRPAARADGGDPGSWIPHTDITRSDLTQVPGKLVEPRDDGPHPGSTTEWWYAHVMDPATHRTFIAMLFTAPVPTALIFWPDLHRSVRGSAVCFVFVLVMRFRLLLGDTLIRCSCGR